MNEGATSAGTRRYAERMSQHTARGHFRERHGLCFSSVGLGTYLGQPDEHTDRAYQEAVKRAIELGCNTIDLAINYRFQRSERAVGAALKQLFESGKAVRGEVIVATKGGFFPYDGEPPRDPRGWVAENVLQRGLAGADEIAAGCHCMTPAYLDDQLTRSLANLELATIDVYYIHNPETQLEAVARDEFNRRIRAAFEFLERAAADGRIQYYGTATWNGYRQEPGSSGYLSLEELVAIAREVAGEDNRFKFIQLPHNLGMPEAITGENQSVEGDKMSALMAAERLGITSICSASIFQGKLTNGLPGFVGAALTGLSTDAQRAIQFVRSTPGVTTALVGMGKRSHVEENLLIAQVPPATIEEFFSMFSSTE